MPQINITSKEAVKELNALINKHKEMRKAITGVGDDSTVSYRKMSKALKELQTVQADTLVQLVKYDKELRNMTKSKKNFLTQTRNLKKELKLTNLELDKANAKLSSLQKKKGVFSNLSTSAKQLLATLGVLSGLQLFGSMITSAFNLTKRLDSLGFAMRAVITDVRELGQTQSWLKDITKDYGAEIVTTTNRYIKFRAASDQAGFSARETQKIFETMTKASGVLGLKTDELTGIYLALEQMISKGKITTEELRRQLGERLPGAMDIMANSMNVTTAELDEMLKKGEVITKDVLPAFADQVNIAFGLDNVKKVETLQAATVRLKNSWTNLVADFAEGNGVSQKLMTVIDHLADNLGTYLKALIAVIGMYGIYKTVLIANSIYIAAAAKITKLLTASYWEQVISQQANIAATKGVTLSQGLQAKSTSILTLASNALIIKLRILWATMLANPLGLIIGLVGAVVIAYNALTESFEESAEAIKEETDEMLKLVSATAELNQETRGLLAEYENLTNKTNLNAEEQERLNRVIVLLGKNVPDAKVAVDEYGRAIEINTKAIKEFLNAGDELADLKAKRLIEENTQLIEDANKKLESNVKFAAILREKGLKSQLEDTLEEQAYLRKTISEAEKKIQVTQDLIDLKESDPTGEISKKQSEQEQANIAAEEKAERNRKEQTVAGIDEIIKAKKELRKEVQTAFVGDGEDGAALNSVEAEKQNILKIREINKDLAILEAKRNRLLGIQPKSLGKSVKQLRLIRDLELEISNIKDKKKVLEFDIKGADDTLDFDDRDAAYLKSSEFQTKIAKNTAQSKIDLINQKLEKEIAAAEAEIKLASTTAERKIALYSHIEGLETEARQKKEIEEGKLAITLFKINKQYSDRIKGIEDERNDAEIEKIEDRYLKLKTALEKAASSEIKANNDAIKSAEEKYNSSKKGLIELYKRDQAIARAKQKNAEIEKRLAEDINQIQIDSANAVIDKQIDILKTLQKSYDLTSEEFADIERMINKLEASRPTIKPNEGTKAEWEELMNGIADISKEAFAIIGDIMQNVFDRRIENIEADIEKTEEWYDRQIELAEGDEAQQKVLRRNKERDIKRLEKERLKEEQKAAKARKAFAVVDIAISTAQAVMRAYSDSGPIAGSVFAAIIAALGAAQIAAVVTQPIPKYKDGGDIKSDHVGMINDGGEKEYIERGGQILSTDTKNAIVPLKAGDTIYKDYDELSRKSILMSGLYNGVQIQRHEFDGIFNGLDDTIKKGFKNAKVSNNIKLVGFDAEHQAYKDSLLNWSN